MIDDKYYTPEPTSGCWIWLFGLSPDGYGKIKASGKTLRAHRYSYTQYKGPIPDKMQVLHKCDNPLCINPDHLFLGTNQDNMRDMKTKSRQAHHERHGRARLNYESVECIRNSKDTTANLARLYMVGESTIRHVRQGTTWRQQTNAEQA